MKNIKVIDILLKYKISDDESDFIEIDNDGTKEHYYTKGIDFLDKCLDE